MIKGVKLFSLFIGFLFLFSSCMPAINTSTLENLVSFDGYKDQQLPVNVAIYLPEEFLGKMPIIGKMPMTDSDPNLWPWFLRKGIEPIFKKTVVIKNLDEIRLYPKVTIIIKPELWGFYHQYSHQNKGRWTCWLDFKFRLLDRDNNEITSISADGIGKVSDKYKGNFSMRRSVVLCMNEVVEKFQRSVFLKKEEILSSF